MKSRGLLGIARVCTGRLAPIRLNAASHKFFADPLQIFIFHDQIAPIIGAAIFIMGSGAAHQMAHIPNGWESIQDEGQAATCGRTEKTQNYVRLRQLARPLRYIRHRRGSVLAAQGKDKTMDTETTNLFRRRDTFFGICEAVGQDFGFNPLYLRLAFIAPLFFFPVQSFAAYFGLGIVVLASRLIFPAKATAPAQPALSATESAEPQREKAEELALAA
ncbi:PspC domain-containing protein [Sphingopyxis sp. RIFCSPHIGHO2_12_FULL_65_19]|uniref:PspC domain-containing protein n=1 Tax=Sphingopyxis sp. RIFCSPHIGHO2_12_FULL_65_19 TaxID=1802172 RepID=UPI0025CB8D38|nr:PspC domain-containing protein [Sphingopyxis sp. RIFCSPHIGHO2_12_FULL_65_19]